MELCGKGIPTWVNRLAYLGSLLPCAAASQGDWITAAPPDLPACGDRAAKDMPDRTSAGATARTNNK